MLQPPEPLCEDKENQRVSRRAVAVLAKDSLRDDWSAKHGRLRQRLVEEQDYLRVRCDRGSVQFSSVQFSSVQIRSDGLVEEQDNLRARCDRGSVQFSSVQFR